MRLYSVYYTSVDYSTCFGCWHPSSGARTTVITAFGTGQLSLLTSVHVVELELTSNSTTRADGSRPGWPVPEAVITVVRAPDDGCQHPNHVELSTEVLINWIQSHLVGQLFNRIMFYKSQSVSFFLDYFIFHNIFVSIELRLPASDVNLRIRRI